MKNSFLIHHLQVLSPEDHERLLLFLQSPYFNTRPDLVQLYLIIRDAGLETRAEWLEKEEIYEMLYPGKPYLNLYFNNTIAALLTLVRQFMALQHVRKDTSAMSIHLLHALRDAHLDQHFERAWQKALDEHETLQERNTAWYLYRYHLQQEWIRYETLKKRSWPDQLMTQAIEAYTKAVALEMVHWQNTAKAYREGTGKELTLPLAQVAIQYLSEHQEGTPFLLLEQSSKIIQADSTDADFEALRDYMRAGISLLSADEQREIYLAAINFSIRQVNKGQKAYMREALELYKEGLATKVILDRGNQLPTNTYYNIHVLAQRCGELEWSKEFLDTYQIYLPRQERENFYQYNLAIYHFWLNDYKKAQDILIHVHFNEIFLNVEVRAMMLRAYFETKSWNALDSLLASFSLFVRRHKELERYRGHYLNLIKFTKKLLKLHVMGTIKRRELLEQAQSTSSLAHKDWVITKIAGTLG